MDTLREQYKRKITTLNRVNDLVRVERGFPPTAVIEKFVDALLEMHHKGTITVLPTERERKVKKQTEIPKEKEEKTIPPSQDSEKKIEENKEETLVEKSTVPEVSDKEEKSRNGAAAIQSPPSEEKEPPELTFSDYSATESSSDSEGQLGIDEKIPKRLGRKKGKKEKASQLKAKSERQNRVMKVSCPKCGLKRWKSEESPLFQLHVLKCTGTKGKVAEDQVNSVVNSTTLNEELTFLKAEEKQEIFPSESPKVKEEEVPKIRKLQESSEIVETPEAVKIGDTRPEIGELKKVEERSVEEDSLIRFGEILDLGFKGEAGGDRFNIERKKVPKSVKKREQSRRPAVISGMEEWKPVKEIFGDYFYILDTNILMDPLCRQYVDDVCDSSSPTSRIRARFVVPSLGEEQRWEFPSKSFVFA